MLKLHRILSETLDEYMFGLALKEIINALNSNFGAFSYFNSSGELICPAMTRDVWDMPKLKNKNIKIPKREMRGMLGRASVERRTICSNKPFRPPNRNMCLDNAMVAPLVYNNNAIGLILVGDKVSDYNENDRKLLTILSEFIAPIVYSRVFKKIERDDRSENNEGWLMNKMMCNTEEKYRSIFNNAGNVIASIDDSGVIVDCNERISELLGFHRDEVLGKRMLNLIHPAHREVIRAQFNNCQRGAIEDYPKYHEFKMVRKDGTVIDVCINSSAVKSENEDYIWSIWVINDITARKAEQQKIVEERNRAEVYLDLMGHDINNYNQAITTYSELLLMKPDLSEDYKKYLKTTLNQSRAITDLVANVGKLSELKKGNFELKTVDLFKSLATAIEHVKQIFPHRGIKIRQSITESEIFVQSIDMLVDAFNNIINNAVKFDKNEVVIIDINYSSDADNKFWRIEISDHGPGIPENNKENIFKWFETGTQSAAGSGLGLALVKEVITLSGGTVWVEDREAGDHSFGSKFIIKLPKEV